MALYSTVYTQLILYYCVLYRTQKALICSIRIFVESINESSGPSFTSLQYMRSMHPKPDALRPTVRRKHNSDPSLARIKDGKNRKELDGLLAS